MVREHITSANQAHLLSAEGVNHESDLNKILSAISTATHEKKVLIFTLFERWRKALYLEIESDESYIHLDEATLAYIHILEVLSDEYKQNLDIKIKEKRKELVTEILECANSENKGLRKITSLLNQINLNQITLKSKVIQMLQDLGLYDLKTDAIIVRFIGHRNSIAHGRKDIYQDKVVYPLKPFFSLIKDIDEDIEVIKILSACTISKYLELNAWTAEWEEIHFIEFTPLSTVMDFIDNQTYSMISNEDFINGKVEGIIPLTLSHYYLKSKISFSILEKALMSVLVTIDLNEDTCRSLFDAAVSLSDSLIDTLAEKCQQIIQAVHSNQWGYYSNIRDILKDYEYHGKKLNWFSEWLTERATA
jgi:predicted transcriptional regulator